MKKSIYTSRLCPFCACDSIQVLGPTTKPQTSAHGKGYQVECLNCGARGPSGYVSHSDAVLAWDNGDGYDKRRLVKTFETTNPHTLEDIVSCLMATIEDSLLQSGFLPGKDYDRKDLLNASIPFALQVFVKKDDVTFTIGWPNFNKL